MISETCVETYFELLLKQLWYKEKKFGDLEDVPFDPQINENYILQMFKTLSQSTLKYSDDHLLILFQQYDCKSCVIVSLLKLNMKQECIKFYAQNNQFGEAIQLYKQSDAEQQNQLYSDLLQLAVQTKVDKNVRDVLELLKNNQSISTLNVIELLVQSNPDLQLDAVYDYLRQKLTVINDQMIQSYQAYQKSLFRLDQTA